MNIGASCTTRLSMVFVSICACLSPNAAVRAEDSAFLPRLINSSTIPSNGDLNPYGVSFVPTGFPAGGAIAVGDVLVSNFNNSMNQQGTGTTIVKLTPSGTPSQPGTAVTFFQSPLAGLSTALGVLRHGFVIVGNVPTTDGTIGTIGQGALQVIDRSGHGIQAISDSQFLDSPWDLTINDEGDNAQVFVANVLSGTVARLDVKLTAKGLEIVKKVVLATGYTHVPNAAALVLGPTGIALEATTDTLFVASTADNAIYAIAHASSANVPVVKGMVIFADSHLRGPLALRFAPNGHLLTANGDAVNADVAHPSEIVEFTTRGQFVRQFNVDASQGGAFGIDIGSSAAPFNFAAIDDVTNNLIVVALPNGGDIF